MTNHLEKKQKAMVIMPPLIPPVFPYLSLPLLAGQLNQAGYETTCLDLNAEFCNIIFTSNYFKNIKQELTELYNQKNLSQEHKNKLNVVLSDSVISFVYKYVDSAIQTFKSEDFYNPELLIKAFKVILTAMKILDAKTYPYPVSYNPPDGQMLLNFDFLYNYSEKYKNNIFDTFYNEYIDKFIPNDIDVIFISVPFEQMIIPAFCLAKILKKRYKSKIVVGGNIISRCIDSYLNHKEFLTEYCDGFMLGEGEYSITKVMEYFDNKRKIKDIEGFVAIDFKGNLIINKPKMPNDLSHIAFSSYDGIDFKKYWTPDIVIPIQMAKGCHWGKCTYCDFSYGKSHYCEKKPKQIVDEIKYLQKNYGFSHFGFVDESVHPDYLLKIADLLKKENIQITYHAFARMVDKFSLSTLQKIYDSGCKLLQWGYESHCKRIVKLMNKGTHNVDRIKIIENSAKVGIWNHVFFIFDFPTETEEEWQITEDFIYEHQDIFDRCIIGSFRLVNYSKIMKNKKAFGLTSEFEKQEFSATLYEKNPEHKYYVNEKITEIQKKLKQINGISCTKLLLPEYTLLYVSRYGREKARLL